MKAKKNKRINKEQSWAGMHGYVMVDIRRHMEVSADTHPNYIMARVFEDLHDFPVTIEEIEGMPCRDRLPYLAQYLHKHNLFIPRKLRDNSYLNG